jgi:hypothetical protein
MLGACTLLQSSLSSLTDSLPCLLLPHIAHECRRARQVCDHHHSPQQRRPHHQLSDRHHATSAVPPGNAWASYSLPTSAALAAVSLPVSRGPPDMHCADSAVSPGMPAGLSQLTWVCIGLAAMQGAMLCCSLPLLLTVRCWSVLCCPMRLLCCAGRRCAVPPSVPGPVCLLWVQPHGGRPAHPAGGIRLQQGPTGTSPAGAWPLR